MEFSKEAFLRILEVFARVCWVPHPLWRRQRRGNVNTVLKVVVAILVMWLILGHRLRTTHRVALNSTASHLVRAVEAGRLGLDDIHKPEVAQSLCREHGWRAFASNNKEPSPASKRKVYDLFLVNTELDWLEIRLNTTYAFVDYFVIVEGRRTFTGLPKPLFVKDNWAALALYHAKIIYHELDYPADFHPTSPWEYEDMQRGAMFSQVFPGLVGVIDDRAPHDGDVLVVADVDEIVRPEALLVLRTCAFPRRLTLRSRFYYYSFQFAHRGADWAHPQATTFHGLRKGATILPHNLRVGDGGNLVSYWWQKDELWNAGWHCSSCFATVGEVLRKMESFSHAGLNAPEFRDVERIVDRVRRGVDLWDREGEVYDRIVGNEDVPRPLLADRERWRYLLDRDGETAGFADYP